jgi:hypothetical protein
VQQVSDAVLGAADEMANRWRILLAIGAMSDCGQGIGFAQALAAVVDDHESASIGLGLARPHRLQRLRWSGPCKLPTRGGSGRGERLHGSNAHHQQEDC